MLGLAILIVGIYAINVWGSHLIRKDALNRDHLNQQIARDNCRCKYEQR